MKIRYTLFAVIAVVSASSQLFAQPFFTVPDANFAGWLNANFPGCMNGNEMNSTCAAIQNAQVVDVSSYNISDLSGVQYFTGCVILKCNFNSIAELPPLPPNLAHLQCLGNQLSELPPLPSTLLYLDCSSNPNLTTFDPWPPQLLHLYLGNQALDMVQFPPLPESLLTLGIQNCELTALPSLPAGLETLLCSNDPIQTLPELPLGLKQLGCLNIELAEWNITLPPLLEGLNCGNNPFSQLPELPATLTSILTPYCQLSALPALPANLNTLVVNNNLLPELPVLPAALSYMECQNNQLTWLPPLPPSLQNFSVQNNQLTSFPTMPEGLLVLNCTGNEINCFPPFPQSLASPNILDNPFTCLPNHIPSMSVFGLLEVPLCQNDDLTDNPYGCPTATGVSGHVFEDEDASCQWQGLESGLNNIPVQLLDGSGSVLSSTQTAGNGIWFLSGTEGDYTVLVPTAGKPYQASCSESNEENVTLSVDSPLVQGIDLAVECVPGFDVGVQSITPIGWVFPGQEHILSILAGDLSYWFGMTCATGTSGTVTVEITGPVTYAGPASGALTPEVAGNTFSYNISDFGQVNFNNDFKLRFTTDTTATSEQQVCVTTAVTPDVGDNQPVNNEMEYCYEVVNSYDPNIKLVHPKEILEEFDGHLIYTIYFQNTGSAPAFNIRVADTLSTLLHMATFETINYSHPCQTTLNGHVVTFRFNNIMLPDSASNPAESIGFVQFKVKPLPGFSVGTQIPNTAHIFFDFNEAIVTPEAVVSVVEENFVFENSIISDAAFVFPNPTRDQIQIKGLDPNLRFSAVLQNALGTTVRSFVVQGHDPLNLSAIDPGIYVLTIAEIGRSFKIIKLQ